MQLEVYKKSDFYEDYISSQKEYYERENADAYFAERLAEKDKEIAELEKKIKFLQVTAICKSCNKCADGMGKVFDENLDELKAQKAQAEDDCAYWKSKAQRERHQKYKRCLAMAGLCDAKADWYYSIGENFRDCVQFNIKWRDKWLELAEKFKEAK